MSVIQKAGVPEAVTSFGRFGVRFTDVAPFQDAELTQPGGLQHGMGLTRACPGRTQKDDRTVAFCRELSAMLP
jgi:hypothetical protein